MSDRDHCRERNHPLLVQHERGLEIVERRHQPGAEVPKATGRCAAFEIDEDAAHGILARQAARERPNLDQARRVDTQADQNVAEGLMVEAPAHDVGRPADQAFE